MGNVLTLTPPLITTEAQMHQAMEIIEESIAEVEQEFGIG
jgi:4-aminobutyrate aminotransferase-like enzyme